MADTPISLIAPGAAGGRAGCEDRAWCDWAIRTLDAEAARSAETHLIRLPLPGLPGVELYLKDESTQPTGSLKHRLARALFLYALCNNWLRPGVTVIEASSGSTAVSAAYFARLLGLRFIAVAPRATAPAKLAAIRFHGGEIRLVDDPGAICAEARRLAAETGGRHLDQFTYAERASDWRGGDSIAASLFRQMGREPRPVPAWIVCGAGTGGASASFGRFIRRHGHATRLCVADPEASVFHRHHRDRAVVESPPGAVSCIEGIGRPRVEPSFIPELVDRMAPVSDARSIGAARALSAVLGRRVGGSTGTNLWACALLAGEMARRGEEGSIATLICDGGERYAETYYNDDWLGQRGLDWRPEAEATEAFLRRGALLQIQ